MDAEQIRDEDVLKWVLGRDSAQRRRKKGTRDQKKYNQCGA